MMLHAFIFSGLGLRVGNKIFRSRLENSKTTWLRIEDKNWDEFSELIVLWPYVDIKRAVLSHRTTHSSV